MYITLLRSKIHSARVTQTDLKYEGSLGIDKNLMKKVGFYQNEKILVVNQNNGKRFETYVIEEPAGSKTFCLNGPATRLGQIDDIIIIMSFAIIKAKKVETYSPTVIHLDENNNMLLSQTT